MFLTPIFAYAAYLALKVAGYTAAAWAFKRLYARPDISIWKVGIARTVLGMVVGGLFTLLWGVLEAQGTFRNLPMSGGRGGSLLYFMAALIPIRFLEWALLLWYFYDRKLERKGLGALGILGATLWSFVIDAPLILGLLMIVASIC